MNAVEFKCNKMQDLLNRFEYDLKKNGKLNDEVIHIIEVLNMEINNYRTPSDFNEELEQRMDLTAMSIEALQYIE
ncbi:MAG: hypothetical protein H7296_03220 [Bacteroidia bacterium]|nr:hypothetical protein [Bacteroidia bacterium]